ncbi:hypothetical protein DH26_gp074 [Chloriridovirus anopheles1]|uniref:Uncharacterized protein n=1 Tax=Chloriridovirus anopheles1 TaxID=1465751 RepID=W8QRF5_9VIRU|nr:hypothetical protein DH26_gp074 [Anopheles minimus iridovirus]AHL67567.1 hypothetical protein AMIV_074 [Anopheles minimus iridovirus]
MSRTISLLLPELIGENLKLGAQCKSVDLKNGLSLSLTISYLADKIYYISDPSISDDLECSIGLLQDCLKSEVIFNNACDEISELTGLSFEKNHKTFSLRFRGVNALKFLKKVFKTRPEHPLYPLYAKWIVGAVWMDTEN